MKHWYRRRRFLLAYRILRNEAERHMAAGHDMFFHATNESDLILSCMRCPWVGPWQVVDSDG
jgi:hypothetical protein